MSTLDERAIAELEDKEYRHSYVADHIRETIALQIRKLRKQRPWTQAALGREAGMAPERISRLEDPDEGVPSVRTLQRLGHAFDLALIVKWVSFSELLESHIGLSDRELAPPSFEADQRLKEMAAGVNRGHVADPGPDQVRSHGFRVVHSTGVFGGVMPTGELAINFVVDRQPYPVTVTHAVVDGKLGREVSREIAGVYIEREIQVEARIDLGQARSLRTWLDEHIHNLEDAIAKRPGAESREDLPSTEPPQSS